MHLTNEAVETRESHNAECQVVDNHVDYRLFTVESFKAKEFNALDRGLKPRDSGSQ